MILSYVRNIIIITFACFTISCGGNSEFVSASGDKNSAILYRNSPLDYQERVHVAKFSGDMVGENGNIENCGMTARVLNSNMDALNEAGGVPRNPRLGFWCEWEGRPNGPVPSTFESEFPSNVRTPESW